MATKLSQLACKPLDRFVHGFDLCRRGFDELLTRATALLQYHAEYLTRNRKPIPSLNTPFPCLNTPFPCLNTPIPSLKRPIPSLNKPLGRPPQFDNPCLREQKR
ncbi:hypothetical protein BC938DRAFT_472752 [Jimgerdemannia flammicorona]|uniref:Uncharacterized protein n=1 Tax=Jimgerdemannia flammicorona TaxID=994334 RepID=A0A433QTR6_9FUNG|nr:hypothetical protein BC938DRAFT_472752 [Jimgerdemannia flammicorona]